MPLESPIITSTETNHIYGSPEHAAEVTKNRHPGIRDGLQWLAYTHLPEPLRVYARPFYRAACSMIANTTTDSPELTTAMNALIAGKDSAMRAGIRHDTGRAGSVPRPQAVIDPPLLTSGEPRCSHSFAFGGDHVCGELPSDSQRVAPVNTEPGCQHPECTLEHPHAGPAVVS
jgi:hypothetical protein